MTKKSKKLNFKETFVNLRHSWDFSYGYRKYLFVYIILSLLTAGIEIISLYIGSMMLLKLSDSLWDQLLKAAIMLLGLGIITAISNFIKVRYVNKYYNYVTLAIQKKICEETLKLEARELDKNSSGVFIERITSDSWEIPDIFWDLANSITNWMGNIGVLVTIFIINKLLLLFYLFALLICYLVKKKQINKHFKIMKVLKEKEEKNSGLISELIRGIRDIKVLNAGENFMDVIGNQLESSIDERTKMENTDRFYMLFYRIIRAVVDFSFIFLGITLCKSGELSAASFLIVYRYSDRIYSLLNYTAYILEDLKRFNMSCNRIFEIIDSKNYVKEKFGDQVIIKANGDFEFKNVNFGYKDSELVLKDMSFKVNANETVAFVGKSGAGKSTIFSLLTKMYNVNSGEILIDGININTLTKDSIRNNISIITQNPYIFNFSIKENLRLAKPDLTDSEMIEVCKIACIHDFFMSLPDGYDTIVGEGGMTLSGGERQRLAIARALLKKTEIILFDEATSALDNETQRNIQQAIDNMKGEYTILIIAHRLSTIKNVDRIYVVDDGKVVATGKESELIKENETFKTLYNLELEK